MEPKVELVTCIKCGHLRERFLIGCPKCGEVISKDYEPEKQVFYEITLETIQHGKIYYLKELTNEQRTFFADRIPSDQNWQFYAGVIIINNLNTVWLNDLTRQEILKREMWDEPISCGNARAFFVMSYKSKENQQKFCDLINAYNHHKIRHEKEQSDKQGSETNVQGEDSGLDDDASSGMS